MLKSVVRIETASPGLTPLAGLVSILCGEVPWQSENLAAAMNASLEPARDNPDAWRSANQRFILGATVAAFRVRGGRADKLKI